VDEHQVEIGTEGGLLASVRTDGDERDARPGIAEQLAQPGIGSGYQLTPKGRPDKVGPALQFVKTGLDENSPFF